MIVAKWIHKQMKHRLVHVPGDTMIQHILERCEKDAAGGDRWVSVPFTGFGTRPSSTEAALADGIAALADGIAALAQKLTIELEKQRDVAQTMTY